MSDETPSRTMPPTSCASRARSRTFSFDRSSRRWSLSPRYFSGAFSIRQTPREEEPQIVVPMLDVFVQMPGASAEEVTQRATVPMEKLLREIPGVEYIYSISHPGLSMVIVRFYVGTNEEDAIVKTYNKLYSNFDRIPQGVSQPIIKVRSIDDVPILALTLWGKNYDAYRLRQIAAELEQSLKQVDDVSETTIIGGQPREVRVVLDTQRLAAYGLTPGALSRNSGPQIRAVKPAALHATTRNSRSRPATSSPARKICSRSSWAFTRDVQSICAMWPKRSRTARRSPKTTCCSPAQRERPEARQVPNFRR